MLLAVEGQGKVEIVLELHQLWGRNASEEPEQWAALVYFHCQPRPHSCPRFEAHSDRVIASERRQMDAS